MQLSVVALVAACSLLGVRGGLVVTSFSKYPGYNGTFNVQGVARLGQVESSQVSLWYRLDGADPLCMGVGYGKPNSCGVHIHSGACSAPPGGHFFAAPPDPWATVAYTSGIEVSNQVVNSGKTQKMNAGNSMVVHDADGGRIACGNLEVDVQQVGTKPVAARHFTKYPGYLGLLEVSGAVNIYQVPSMNDSSVPAAVLDYFIKGVDTMCSTSAVRSLPNSCGIHVHSGPCSNAGGHYFSGPTDPWGQVVYFSDAAGSTDASISVQVQVKETVASMVDRSFVVHDFSGVRVACATIKQVTVAPEDGKGAAAATWWEPTDFGVAILLAMVSTVCWGSWSNTAKAAGFAGVNFAYYYVDFCLGTILATLIYWGGPGRFALGAEWVDVKRAWFALAAGAVFGVANLLLTTGIAVAGLSIAFPLCIGTGLVLGTVLTYVVDPHGNPALIFPGVFCALLGVICNARAYGLLQEARSKDAKKSGSGTEMTGETSGEESGATNSDEEDPTGKKGQAFRNIILCVVGGLLMGCWSPLSANAMKGAEGLSPYASSVFFTLSSFVVGLLILSLQMCGCQVIPRVDPVTNACQYLSIKPCLHLWGLLGGIIWATGTTANLVSGKVVGFALSYALGQTAPVIAILWGLGWYREFDGAPRRAIRLIGLMFFFFFAAIAMLCVGGKSK